jgi:hypothetical protein
MTWPLNEKFPSISSTDAVLNGQEPLALGASVCGMTCFRHLTPDA